MTWNNIGEMKYMQIGGCARAILVVVDHSSLSSKCNGHVSAWELCIYTPTLCKQVDGLHG
jgi:hypothetical protein